MIKRQSKEPDPEPTLSDLLGDEDRGGYQPVDKKQEPDQPPQSEPGVSIDPATESSEPSGET